MPKTVNGAAQIKAHMGTATSSLIQHPQPAQSQTAHELLRLRGSSAGGRVVAIGVAQRLCFCFAIPIPSQCLGFLEAQTIQEFRHPAIPAAAQDSSRAIS